MIEPVDISDPFPLTKWSHLKDPWVEPFRWMSRCGVDFRTLPLSEVDVSVYSEVESSRTEPPPFLDHIDQIYCYFKDPDSSIYSDGAKWFLFGKLKDDLYFTMNAGYSSYTGWDYDGHFIITIDSDYSRLFRLGMLYDEQQTFLWQQSLPEDLFKMVEDYCDFVPLGSDRRP